MLDLLHFIWNRRKEAKKVNFDRRAGIAFPGCRRANRVLQESINNLDEAITRAVERTKK